jgi:LysR family positive regulator for ilvC
MNLDELKLFLKLAETLHFGQASSECHLSPSAFSRAIMRIESEVGKPLFVRDNRTVELTPEGILFKEFAQGTIDEWVRFQNRLEGDLTGELSLYCTVTACYTILPSLLTSFLSAYPRVSIQLRTGAAAQAMQQVLESKVDLSIVPIPETLPSPVAFRSLLKVPLVWVIPNIECNTRDLFNHTPIDYQKIPMILPQGELSRSGIDSWFKSKGIQPNVYAHVSGNEAIMAMVGLGLGAGILPRLVVESSPLRSKTIMVPIDPPIEPYNLGLCVLRRKMGLNLVKAFWDKAVF